MADLISASQLDYFVFEGYAHHKDCRIKDVAASQILGIQGHLTRGQGDCFMLDSGHMYEIKSQYPAKYQEEYALKTEDQPESVEKSEAGHNPNLTPEGLQGNIQSTIDHAGATIDFVNQQMEKRSKQIAALQNEQDQDIQWRDSLAQSIHRLREVLDASR